VDEPLQYTVVFGYSGAMAGTPTRADSVLPLALVVVDPAGDSIGFSFSDGAIFNTISDGSSYQMVDISGDNAGTSGWSFPTPSWERTSPS